MRFCRSCVPLALYVYNIYTTRNASSLSRNPGWVLKICDIVNCRAAQQSRKRSFLVVWTVVWSLVGLHPGLDCLTNNTAQWSSSLALFTLPLSMLVLWLLSNMSQHFVLLDSEFLTEFIIVKFFYYLNCAHTGQSAAEEAQHFPASGVVTPDWGTGEGRPSSPSVFPRVHLSHILWQRYFHLRWAKTSNGRESKERGGDHSKVVCLPTYVPVYIIVLLEHFLYFPVSWCCPNYRFSREHFIVPQITECFKKVPSYWLTNYLINS